ncbi:hypothetical protein [Roseateles sp.]|uniref:hypothetical protein n=1 Tax=Roseateles sp. TaxID=1971397 RepID=UPI0032647A61
MTEFFTRHCVVAAWTTLAVAASTNAQAQNQTDAPKPAVATQRADPADARADVPRLVYRSPMQGWRPYADTEPAPWVETNKTVAAVGGWRVYAKEARQPDVPDAPDAASAPASAAKPDAKADTKADATKPQPAGHAGHKMN